MSRKVRILLKRLQRDSRAGVHEEEVHLVRWQAIWSGKTMEGLGVRRSPQ